jgi:ribosomal protein S10
MEGSSLSKIEENNSEFLGPFYEKVNKKMSIQEFTLPTKIKRFTVIKSPHKYKSSREQFQYTRVKKCFTFETNQYWIAMLFIRLVKDCQFAGTELQLDTISFDYFVKSF